MQPAGPYVNDSSNLAAFDARRLRFWLATLSPSDLSVNEAAAARPGSAMITGIGSANDVLWSQMERTGWAQQIAFDDPPLAGLASTYAFTEAGALAVTTALAEVISWKTQIMEIFDRSGLHTAPEHVRQLCSLFGRLALRSGAQLAIVKKATPETEEAQAEQRECILALNEISKGVLTAGQFIVEALLLGPESDAGRDRLERTNKGLAYAERCLTEWLTKIAAMFDR
jgi:hypothetical protein